MTVARKLPLSDNPLFQATKRLALSDVPAVPVSAVPCVDDESARSTLYNCGRQRWRTRIGDKSNVLVYILYRDRPDIEDGAFPWLEFYTDGSF